MESTFSTHQHGGGEGHSDQAAPCQDAHDEDAEGQEGHKEGVAQDEVVDKAKGGEGDGYRFQQEQQCGCFWWIRRKSSNSRENRKRPKWQ